MKTCALAPVLPLLLRARTAGSTGSAAEQCMWEIATHQLPTWEGREGIEPTGAVSRLLHGPEPVCWLPLKGTGMQRITCALN